MKQYVGRFAPSPTGPLHFGSLITAMASFLEARRHGGRWLLRIENIDPPREQSGAADSILSALDALGFEWDGPVRFQSSSRHLHDAAINALLASGLAYPCGCSRSDLEGAELGDLGPIYPGTCRNGTDANATAIRVRTNSKALTFMDGLQGKQSQCLEKESGDFIVRRKDGLVAYHLAVVVDDHDQHVTDIVRGIDLMDSTPRQIWLQQLLGYHTPNYVHIPVAVNDLGQKLGKSTGAPAVNLRDVAETLVAALTGLRQLPAADLATAGRDRIWEWAFENWKIDQLHAKKTIPYPARNH